MCYVGHIPDGDMETLTTFCTCEVQFCLLIKVSQFVVLCASAWPQNIAAETHAMLRLNHFRHSKQKDSLLVRTLVCEVKSLRKIQNQLRKVPARMLA